MEFEMTRQDKVQYDRAILSALRAEESGFVAAGQAFRDIAAALQAEVGLQNTSLGQIAS